MFNVSITIPDIDRDTHQGAAETARLFLANEISDHELQFTVNEHTPITLQPTGLELPRMLVLSTAHIRASTNSNLECKTDDCPVTYYPKVDKDGTEYGWIFPLVEDYPWSHMVSDDLLAIRRLATLYGATATPTPSPISPTYDW